jgi:hypothetical protein
MLFESEADKLAVRVDDGCPRQLRAFEALTLDGVVNGIGMDVQFGGNGADLPMFGVK